MQNDQRPTGRRAARLAQIDAQQADLVAMNDNDVEAGWNEASQFNLDHCNRQWSQLEAERQTTLAA